MNSSLSEIRRYVEPGRVPKTVRFYGTVRRIRTLAPLRAMALGAALGAGCMAIAFAAVEIFAS